MAGAAPDYVVEARCITDSFLALVEDQAAWTTVKKADGVRVSKRPSEFMDGSVYRCDVDVAASAVDVFTMVAPMRPFRPRWDAFLDDIRIVATVDKNVYIVYHVLAPALKGLIGARDSVDLVTVGESDAHMFIACAGVTHADYPPQAGYVRAIQFPCGYYIRKLEGKPDNCQFSMILHADLSLNGVASFVTSKVKPTLMLQKVNCLRKGLDEIQLTENDIVRPIP